MLTKVLRSVSIDAVTTLLELVALAFVVAASALWAGTAVALWAGVVAGLYVAAMSLLFVAWSLSRPAR